LETVSRETRRLDKTIGYESWGVSLILATFGRSDKALDIAESFRDYKSLVELCLEPRDEDVHRAERVHERLEYYLMHYGEDFAFTLYNFYLQNRMLHSRRV
jgi:hypothetical protein